MPYTGFHAHLDAHTVALNAAGIADSFSRSRTNDHDGNARYASIADECGGFIAIADAFAIAGAVMEMFRMKVDDDAAWGGELPHVYLAWKSIAEALWEHWEVGSVSLLTERALLRLVMQQSADRPNDPEERSMSPLVRG